MAGTDRDGGDSSAGTLSTRQAGLAGLRNWLFLDGNRYVLAAGIVAVGFGLFAWLGYSGVVDVDRSTTPMLYLFSTLVAANVTLITIVVTISQLILSRELRSPRELELEIESAEEYRESVEEETASTGIPERPDEFLRVLVADTRRQVLTLDAAADGRSDSALQDELETLASNLGAELEETLRQLEMGRSGVFPALATVLDADFSTRLNHSRWIQQSCVDELSESELALLDDLEGRVEQLDIARHYFKTVYIKQELAGLSNLVVYTGLVATLVALAFLMITGSPGPSFSPLVRVVLVPAAVAVNLAPLALFIAHVLRITTVVRRTAAITPFISPGE